MKRKCDKCGDTLSAIEIKANGDEEGYDRIWICDHCYMLEQNQGHSFDYEQYSDADSGL